MENDPKPLVNTAPARLRKPIQAIWSCVSNAYVPGFIGGTIFRGASKQICAPGLNCYSCPGALGACPIGSIQTLAGNGKTLVSCYVYGFLILIGVILGRAVCGFLCPFGLAQELLNKIPLNNIKHSPAFRVLTKLKYAILIVMVVAIPTLLTLTGRISFPVFCEYFCPAGTLEAGVPLAIANDSIRAALGGLFVWKAAVLTAILLACVKLYRPFCRFFCPLGAIYSLFNRVSVIYIRRDMAKCDGCGKCAQICGMEAVSPDEPECIRCGKCAAACPTGALEWANRLTSADHSNLQLHRMCPHVFNDKRC